MSTYKSILSDTERLFSEIDYKAKLLTERRRSFIVGRIVFGIAVYFVAWTLWFGLPTPWGTLDIDIFPPGIYVTGGPAKK